MFNENLDGEPQVDLTPIIDVIFMLLIFFIMTTTFSKPVLDIILPTSETAQATTAQKDEIVISITSEGKSLYQENEISPAEMEELFNSRPDSQINLYVDEKTPFDAFVRVVDVVKKRPGGHFVISTQPAAKTE